MKTVADDCWQIAAKCEHWAEESQDDATRLAFRQMAKALAGLAFSEQFGPAEGLRRPRGYSLRAHASVTIVWDAASRTY